MKAIMRLCALTFSGLIFIPQSVYAIPRCQSCPYSCAYLDLGGKDCSNTSVSRGLCCVDLSREGMEIANAQQQALGAYSSRDYRAQPRVAEHCPSGFRPSEDKCRPEERRKGCKDIRMPGGLGCVNR